MNRGQRAVVVIASCVVAASARGQTDAGKLADAMVRALHENHATLSAARPPASEQATRAQFTHDLVDTSLAITGERLTPNQRVMAAFQINVWFYSRQPLGPAVIAKYLSRLRTIDKATVTAWLAAESRATGEKTPAAVGVLTMTHTYVAVQDYLFEDGAWKKNQPERALARMGSISTDALSRWRALVKSGGDALDNAWTIVTVDELFVNDVFQQARFDAAFPIAQTLLPAR